MAGQAVEDMLEGLTCQECGEFFDDVISGGEPPGHPRSCPGCGGGDASGIPVSAKPPRTAAHKNRRRRQKANRLARQAAKKEQPNV